jgi:predicted enzyme related to lactoylglutathione lyase
MTSSVHTLTVDALSPARVAEFWAQVLGEPAEYDPVPEDDDWAAVGAEGGPGLRVLFLKVPDAKTVKNRLHLDLTPSTSRAAEVERIATLGATVVADFYEHGRWTLMRDPEGNEFCVLRSLAEKQAGADEHDE